jgi:hypothetical protein
LMLNPKRLCGSSLARKKTVKWELERRFPARYTASNSPRRTNRASRGNRFPRPPKLAAGDGFPELFGGEPMTSLLAARCQHFAAALRLHANAKAVRLGAPASSRLKCALWQNNPPLLPAICHMRYVIRNRRAVSFIRNGRTAHYFLQRLIPNLVVYSTLARRVKKCAEPSRLSTVRSYSLFGGIHRTPLNSDPRPFAVNNTALIGGSWTARRRECESSSSSTSSSRLP